MNRCKGFTLVELLIVVLILGILAAVIIPNVVGLLGRSHRGNETGNITPTPTIAAGNCKFLLCEYGLTRCQWIYGPCDFHDSYWKIRADNTD